MAEQAQQQGGGSLQDYLLDMGSRLRSIEGRYNLLRDRVLIINNNMITEYKKIIGEIRELNRDIKDIKTDIFRIKETLKHIIGELDRFSRKEDVKLLEKYINLWNPMNFVSEKEVQKMIDEALHKKKRK